MAHHDSTPASVLDAPALTPVRYWTTAGPNRATRRAYGGRYRNVNTPYVAPVDPAGPTRRKARAAARRAAKAA